MNDAKDFRDAVADFGFVCTPCNHLIMAENTTYITPLPPEVEELLETVGAAPRLRAHLALVHDTAARMTERISVHWPTLEYDPEAVRMGAATHDIGKAVFPEELVGEGRHHEAVGAGVLADCGFPVRFARFTRTHGRWEQEEGILLEDLLVALADTLWKGKRDDALEDRCCRRIAAISGLDPWRVSLRFYEMMEEIADGAAERVVWQQKHGLTREPGT